MNKQSENGAIKDLLRALIKTFHKRKIKTGLARELDVPLHAGKVITLIGARRAGKTYLLYQKIRELLEQGVPKRNILFLNFEDERLNLQTNQLDLILQAYREIYPDLDLEGCYLFFDEVQNIPGWEKFIRRVYDQETQHIFITGSSSKLLSTEIATALRGRTLTFVVYPLAFREYLRFHQLPDDPEIPEEQAQVVKAFGAYLQEGGFPEISLERKTALKTKILQDYFNVMIFRDLVERFNISDVVVLKFFIKRVFATVSSPLSVNKIYRDIRSQGYEVGKNKLYEYLEHIQDIFLIRRLNKFSHSYLNQEHSEKKAYAIDHGMLSAINFSLSEDRGRLLENLVVTEFYKAGKVPFYFKKNRECDLVIAEGNQLEAIQITDSMTLEATRERELKGLLTACQELSLKDGLILTHDHTEELNYKGVHVRMVPVWRYFLRK